MGKAERRATGRSDEDEENQLGSSKKRRSKRPSGGPLSKNMGAARRAKRSTSKLNRCIVLMSQAIPRGSDFLSLASSMKTDPAGTSKRVLKRVFIFVWCVAVFLAVLSLIGVNVMPSDSVGVSTEVSASGLLTNVHLPEFLGLSVDDEGATAREMTSSATDVEGIAEEKSEDEIPAMQGYEVKKPNKINKAKEKELACKEVDCNKACMKKITPKCEKKKSCRSDREKICKRRCSKARCEERCKDEPHFGYVEREQKMDKCKEGCQGNTAQHNKCIKKCHSEYKPCKSRCHEIFSRFKCPEEEQSSLLLSSSAHSGTDDLDMQLSETEKSAASSLASVEENTGTDFDDEII